MITLMLLLPSVWKVEGNTVEDWRESAFKIHSFDCNTPTIINKLHLPEVCFIPEKKLGEELAAAQPAWILGEEYIHELSGVVCSATISGFRGYCGAYSHWKFMDVPEIEADEPVTLEQCMSAKKGFFKTPAGQQSESLLLQGIPSCMNSSRMDQLRCTPQIHIARECLYLYIRVQ